MGNAVNFLKTVWVKAHGGSNPSSCATNKSDGKLRRFCLYGLRMVKRASRDELPFKKSINNAFQGRDEQTHKRAFAGTECKENRTLHEKSRFAGAKRFALRWLDYSKIDCVKASLEYESNASARCLRCR